MRVVLLREDRMNYVISGIVLHYQVSWDTICKYCRRPDKIRRKQMAIKLLRDLADVSHKEIANKVGLKEANTWVHYSTLTEEMAYDKKLRQEYETLKEKLLNP